MFLKAYQAWLHGDSFRQAGNMFGVEYYLQTISQMFHANQNTLHDKKVSFEQSHSLVARFRITEPYTQSNFDNMNGVECRRPLR